MSDYDAIFKLAMAYPATAFRSNKAVILTKLLKILKAT